MFTVGVVFLLLGLTNKQTADWTDVSVGGFLLIAAVVTPVFLFIESRAAEPIVPLELFRNRNYSVTILATFLAAIGFFGAVIFLPRWFQFVQGVSPTESGLQILPLLAGVIISSIVAGALVSRSGQVQVDPERGARHHVGGHPALHRPGARARTCRCCGSGCSSPAWASAPPCPSSPSSSRRRCPSAGWASRPATSSSSARSAARSGLAVVGTIFAQQFASRLQPSLLEAGVPAQQAAMVADMAATGGDLTQVGDMSLPDQLAQVPPLAGIVDQVVAGIYQAFSQAIGDTFWLGFGATLVALVVVTIGLRDVPLLGRGESAGPGEELAGEMLPQAFG